MESMVAVTMLMSAQAAVSPSWFLVPAIVLMVIRLDGSRKRLLASVLAVFLSGATIYAAEKPKPQPSIVIQIPCETTCQSAPWWEWWALNCFLC